MILGSLPISASANRASIPLLVCPPNPSSTCGSTLRFGVFRTGGDLASHSSVSEELGAPAHFDGLADNPPAGPGKHYGVTREQ
jgi:hypothetical protein